MADECPCCAEGEESNLTDSTPDDESVTTSVVVYREALPAERRGGALTRTVRNLPAPVVRTAAAVAVGAAVQVGVVLAGKYLAAQSAQKTAKALTASARSRPKTQPRQEDEERSPGSILSETLIVRRVWLRRDND